MEELAELIGRLAEDPSAAGPPAEADPVRRHPGSAAPPAALLARAGTERKDRPAPARAAEDRPARNQAAEGRPPGRGGEAALSIARAAALLVFLCGAAHAPRYRDGLSEAVLGATVVIAGLCMLAALALRARATAVRLVAAAVAAGVTGAVVAGHLLGRTGPAGLAGLWDGTLAPPWLAATTATAAALAALAVLAAGLAVGVSRRRGAGS
ncbi:hypothetical protein NX794_15695 [Streptomyces sp. LP11]|uniref:Integral membrane protein n=1 Tax=Streptomyces pyxinicus TaxID=2970331 RepID=A0ABT2B2J3_9ACTN|nr:hypothetical protein [Streptomyces sp. LP11]MCS0602642.1 hypothetical protein [Streptomyces sp. LP11]